MKFKFYNKNFGLMFRNIKNNAAVLKDYNNEYLHTFFVFYPIDIVFLDSKFKVIKIKRRVKPFTLKIMGEKKAKYVLEFRTGNTKNIKIGKKIKLR
ncbi:MAG: hypothetical protein QT11_C0001G0096 [archaeon GW2011_AR20]|nr:MAG: hypothetical protein QT11_C0001G0096 [archaeon GW2011_AR20]MBS3160726.1 DUF192 domain-containing protein [Candidatus Woesearchaeota archaeon]